MLSCSYCVTQNTSGNIVHMYRQKKKIQGKYSVNINRNNFLVKNLVERQ